MGYMIEQADAHNEVTLIFKPRTRVIWEHHFYDEQRIGFQFSAHAQTCCKNTRVKEQ